MKFKNLSDQNLLQQTKQAAEKEQNATLELLEYLVELDDRKLYVTDTCNSLQQFMIKEYKYSESSASERVAAMRLLKSSPQVKELLQTKEMNLTSLVKIQRFIRNENIIGKKIDQDQKNELIKKCSGQSSRQIEKILVDASTDEAKFLSKETTRIIKNDRVELKFSINDITESRLQRAKELVGITSHEDLFAQALEALIEQKERELGKANKDSLRAPEVPAVEIEDARYIPMAIKRIIYARSKGQCEHIHDGKRCISRYRLEIDHIRPIAQGGKTNTNNLRHLCRAHNQRVAIQAGLKRKLHSAG